MALTLRVVVSPRVLASIYVAAAVLRCAALLGLPPSERTIKAVARICAWRGVRVRRV